MKGLVSAGRPPGRGGSRGVGLVEVLVAAALLAAVALPIGAGIVAAARGTGEATDLSVAYNLLRMAAEDVKARGFDGNGLGTTLYPRYQGSAMDVEIVVDWAPNMTDHRGNPVVKSVDMRIYRHPRGTNPRPLVRWVLLLVKGGL